MRGTQGLVIALALGLAGGVFNWLYLAGKAQRQETVSYVGVAPEANIARGEVLQESHLVRVDIPRSQAGNLDEFAYPWSTRESVVGSRVWRDHSGGYLLLRDDLKTPAQELKFGENERVVWLPVDNRTFVPSLVEPGDMVSFIAGPAPAGYDEAAEDETGAAAAIDGPQPRLAGNIDTIGPFRILSLGNRLGSAEVRRSSRMPTVQENVIAIAIEVDSAGNPIAQAAKLLKMLNETNFRPMGILLHPRKGKTLAP